jgi:protein-L-isoaspartate(D-aspartate) O-methyltransferase
MSVEYFDEQRRQLIAAIRAHTEQVAARIGKTALDKQVLRAMTKVPRHEFVPAEVQSWAYLDTPYRSVSVKPSRSRSWSR